MDEWLCWQYTVFTYLQEPKPGTLARSRIVHYFPLAKLNPQDYNREKCVSALNPRDCSRITVTQWIQK
jgi:hypothetical protein